MATVERTGGDWRNMLTERPRLLLAAAASACVLLLFWEAIQNLAFRWRASEELSHMFFIPLISVWLVWANRDAVSKSVGEPSLWGAAGMLFAGFLLLLGQLTHIFLVQHIGLVFAIASLVTAFGGLSLLRATAAPVIFLFFAIPPPFWVNTVLSWKFQEWSSILGVWMIGLMNIPVFLSGNIIDLGEYKLQVAEACSGLRYLFPFLSIGVMTAYLYRGPLWGKLLIVFATIPITILMNSFRIAITGALVQAYGPSHAEGALHFFEGWVVFLLCLAALFGIVIALSALQKPRRRVWENIGAPDLKPVAPSQSGKSALFLGGAVLGTLAVVFAVGQAATTDALIKPERAQFASITSEFPDWRTEIRPIDADVAETLGADDAIVLNLVSPEGEFYNFYAAYLDSQRDGRSWHSPRQCIPGGGWQITDHQILNRETADGRQMTFNRLLIENRNHRQLVYYWYDQRGRKIANEFTMKFWLLFDAVFKNRSDGAMVRLMTPITDETGVAAADAKLSGMVEQLEEFLPEYVPN